MKILQITNSFYPVIGGQEKVVLEISKGLIALGHEITVLTTNYLLEEKVATTETLNKIKIFRFPNKYWFAGYGYSPEALKWLKENYKGYDLIHCHGYNRYLPEFAVKFLYKKKPIVFSPHGFIHTKKNILAKKIHDIIIGRWIRKANICIALTKLDFNNYKKLGVKKQNIIEIPNGVDLEKFERCNVNEIKKIKKRFGLDKKTLLYVGRIHKSKGLQHVAEVMKDLDCKLLIVGPDSGYKKELKNKIERLKIQNRVIFAGKINDKDLINVYFASDIFILFSEWEGFGIVVIEAMAAGLPVLASDRGALPFLIKNNFNGKIIKFGDVNKLKNKIEKLLSNDFEIKVLGNNAKDFSKQYSWKDIIKMYEKIYNKLLK